MADLSQISSQLWTSGAISRDSDIDQMVGAGITADLDLRQDATEEKLLVDHLRFPNAAELIEADPRIDYCYNGTPDDKQPKPPSWFQASWDFAEPILDKDGVLLAHCHTGINRGPSTVYFLLRAYFGMTGDAAYALLVERRPIAEVYYRPDADEALVALGLS